MKTEVLNICVSDTVVIGKAQKPVVWTIEYALMFTDSGATTYVRVISDPNEMSLPPTFYSPIYYPSPVA